MIKDTTRIAGYEFENEDVIIDFTAYESCLFKKCKIIYYGHGPFHMQSDTFEDCTYELAGPAASAIGYLRALYHGSNKGGKELAEAYIQLIRTPLENPTDQK